MTKALSLPGGELEYAVLAALWELEAATPREVHGRVAQPGALAYTTTAKVLERLRAKGLASRRKSGRTFIYRAAIARERIGRARTKLALTQLLVGAVRPAMATLVEAVEAIDPDLLDELEEVVRDRRKMRRES